MYAIRVCPSGHSANVASYIFPFCLRALLQATYPVLTNTCTAHLFPALEVGCNLKAGGRAQSQKGLGIMSSQHGFEGPRAAALSVQVCQEGVEWWLVGPAPASKRQEDRAELHWRWFKGFFRTGGSRRILV